MAARGGHPRGTLSCHLKAALAKPRSEDRVFAYATLGNMRLPWLLAALFLAALLAWLHVTALGSYWYWYFPWLDAPVHFLAGVFMATAVIGVLGTYRPLVFVAAVVVGALGWEAFELAINAEREANFIFDTSLDLLMDTLGIVLGYVVARLTIWRST